MREAISHSGLRLHQWLLLFGGLLYGTIYMGILQPRGIAAWFANQPEVSRAFSDPNFGRADALILLFSTLFLGPLALLRLPDWLATAGVLLAVVTVLWTQSTVWLPKSIWFLGLLARACRIVVSV